MKHHLGLKPFLLIFFWLTQSLVAASTTPGFFRLSEAADFKRGQFQNTYLKENGALSLTPGCRKMADIEATIIWTVFENRDGLWIGTGHKGELFRVNGAKKIETPIALNASEVLSIEEGPDGALYIGTAPKGVIYRLPRGSVTPEVFLILPESYVWDLASDGKSIYAATGSSGKIYRLDLTARKAEVFFTTGEDNVLEVKPTKNYVYASTGGRGYLYKIKSPKEFEILYDAGGRDINDFLFGEDGILLATSGKKLIAESSAPSYASGNPESKTYYFQNEVIQVDDKGSFKSLFEIRNQTIPAIARQGENTILIGTGEEGEIHSLDLKTRRSRLLHKLPGNSIASFTSSKNNLHFVSGNGKALYQLETEYAKKGTYTTDVFDTRGTSIWGHVLFTSSAPATPDEVRLVARTGNTYTPGQSWSEWTPLDKNQVTNKAARFIQIRFELGGTGGGSPELSDIRIYYGQENKTASLSFFSAGRNPEFEKNFKLNLAEDDLLLSWDLYNDDGDPVYYKLSYKNTFLGDWKEIGNRFRNKYHIFKRSQLPDGEYFFKIVLHDVNAGTGASETDSLASRKVTIDNTPPWTREVSLKNGVLSFKVVDNLSPVYRVEYSWLFEDFRSLLPVDGVNDFREESYTLKVPESATFVVLRVTDDAGNANYESFEIKGGVIQPVQKK